MSASKSPKVVKSAPKPVSKYASRYVGDIMDKLIEKALKKDLKHPKTVAKWMAKMKLSVQRKVSQFSREAFVSESERPESLRREIDTLKKEIADIQETIRRKNLQAIEQTDFKSHPNADLPPQYRPRDMNIHAVMTSFKSVVQSLGAANRNADERLARFDDSLKTLQSNLPPVLSSLNQRRAASGATAAPVSHAAAAEPQSSKKPSHKAKERDEFDKLLAHLEGGEQ